MFGEFQKAYQEIEKRGLIITSLKTRSLEVARVRQDAIREADNHYWASLPHLPPMQPNL